MAQNQTKNQANNLYDAIVIGARCAGSPTAMLLARQGYRVLLLEKATFPSEIPRGYLILGAGTRLLQQWNLLDRVVASNSPLITKFTFDLGPLILRSHYEHTPQIAPRRSVLDTILADAAVESGAERREGFLVQEILMDGERVTGIRGCGSDGIQVTEHAKMVIGADGLYSLVAQAVQAPKYNIKPSLSCAYFTFFDNLPVEGITVHLRGKKLIATLPTTNNQTAIGLQFLKEELPTFRADIVGNFMEIVGLVPELATRVRHARQMERFLGVTDLPNFFRKPYGPGWALVGDAGYHKDPYGGHGISDAFFSAQLLTEAIDAGLSGRQSLEDALANYEQKRNEDAFPKYELNWQLATFEDPAPEMQQLFAALAHNEAETNRFVAALNGIIPIPEFFAPDNLARIIAQNDTLGVVPNGDSLEPR
jgi:flavin-dependent dehydrogenase